MTRTRPSGRHRMRALAAFVCATVLAPAAAAPTGEVMAKLSRAVLKVTAVGDGDDLSIGSAVVIGPDTVLTNCHVVRHARTIVLSRGLAQYAVVGERADMSRDLCLLHTEKTLPHPGVDIRAARTLQPGEPVVAHGYTGGTTPLFARGVVVDLHAASGSHVIQTSAGFMQGASGGGLFDEAGKLIGITTFFTAAERAAYFAVPADWSARVLERAEHAPRPLGGSALWERLPSGQPHFMRMIEPLSSGDWARVAELAEAWSEAAPQAPAAWLMRARAARALGRVRRADMWLRHAITLARQDRIELARIAAHARDADLQDALALAVTALARLQPVPLPD